jgi:phosphoribosylformylglycinamidine (FGAM) synthase-like enzyme
LAVIDEKNNLKVKEILLKWQIDYEVIGEITNNKRVVFESNNEKVVDLPVDIIVDDAPEYDREFYKERKRKGKDTNTILEENRTSRKKKSYRKSINLKKWHAPRIKTQQPLFSQQ